MCITLVSHLAEERLREATIEAGGASGTYVGAITGFMAAPPIPLMKGIGTVVGGVTGSNIGQDFIRVGLAPEPPANDVNLKPTLIMNGNNYYLIDNHWFVENTTTSLPNRYGAITVPDKINELSDAYMQASLSPEEYQRVQQSLEEIKQQGDTVENIEARIKPVGQVTISDTVDTPSKPDSASNTLPTKEAYNQWLPNNPNDPSQGKHMWLNNKEGNHILITQTPQGTSELELSAIDHAPIYSSFTNAQSGETEISINNRPKNSTLAAEQPPLSVTERTERPGNRSHVSYEENRLEQPVLKHQETDEPSPDEPSPSF